MWLPVPGVPVSTFYLSNVFSQLNVLIELVLMMGRCGEARKFLKLCLKKIDKLNIKVGLDPRDCSIQSANKIEFCTAAVGLGLKTEPRRFEPATSIVSPRKIFGGGTSSQDT